jgi:NCS2 family nucleobase:cation symporter-2/xanthine permease XanP
MNPKAPGEDGSLQYAVDEPPPHWLSALLGFQVVALILSGIVLVPLIALDAAGMSEDAKNWAVFGALLVSGAVTILQAKPLGPVGAGYVLFMGTSGAFIAVSISALEAGGLPLLATLIVASSLVQFLFAQHLGLLRKIVTPTVGGTVVALIAVAVIPISLNMLKALPENFSGSEAAPAWAAAVTLTVILALSFFGSKKWRLWGPVVGVVAGSVLAYFLGLTDLRAVAEASVVGLPAAAWPGLDLSFSTPFWVLLPGFIIVTLIGALETYGDGIAIQEVSRRGHHPTDFKVVQGAVNADGMGNLLSGLIGTLPNTTYSTSVSVADLTGVAARRVGVYGGLLLILLAFSPKVSALLQAIPGPVAGAFIFFLIVLLFAHGIKLIVSDGLSFDNGIVFGVSFWMGYGFQAQAVFHELMPPALSELLDNGMTTGGITAVVLSLILNAKKSKAYRITVPARASSLPDLMAFARARAQAADWRGGDIARLELALEEAFLYQVEKADADAQFKIRLSLRTLGAQLEAEFVSAPAGENLQSIIERLEPVTDFSTEDLRLRLLTGMVDELFHEQFNQQDFLSLVISQKRSLDRLQ